MYRKILTLKDLYLTNNKYFKMPSQGEYQKPAGVNISPAAKPLGTRIMESNITTIKPKLGIYNCEYKGNAVLNANK